MSRTLLTTLLGAALFAGLLGLAWRSQRTLEAGLPLRLVCRDQASALVQAGPTAVPIAGTGSMAPYIPAAAPGSAARTTVVAYAVPVAGATFADITPGALCIYAAEWAGGGHVIHQAAARDAGGWIMSGLHNARSESWARVTAVNFRALVARVYVWEQPGKGAE